MTAVPTIALATLGCKVNQAETIHLLSQLQQDVAVVPFDQAADIYLINTCTVTHEADRQSRQLIRRAHRKNPEASIVVTGCAVDYAPDDIRTLPGVRLAAANAEKAGIARAVADWYGLVLAPAMPLAPGSNGNHTRAWLKVSEGCDNNCAFCVIPAVRGPERSIPAGDLVGEARRLAEAGYREIVLTGTNIGSYGRDGLSGLQPRRWRGSARGATLAPLVEALIAEVPEIARWRISSIEPIDFPDDLVVVFAHAKVCPHVHLCLQSGSDAILARMRRRYNTAMYRKLVEKLRASRPDITLTTDVIVGFPGEGDAEFVETLAFLRELRVAQAHLFPYSDRAGTHAATLDGHVPRGEISQRMDRAADVVRHLHAAWSQAWIGQEVDVLVERVNGAHATGTTPHYLKVMLPAEGVRSNEIARVRVDSLEDAMARATSRS
jgi:threonylcarbamoyladenosine tRNA methylthiotransferase MtaB